MNREARSRSSSSTDDPVAVLYEKYNALLEAKDVSELSNEFSYAISCSKGIDKEKILASQIICKFIKHFSDLQLRAVNALIDLCEDDSDIIRISAIKHISVICKECPELIPRLVDILTQLVGMFSGKDYNLTCSCVAQIFKEHQLQTTKTILNQAKICSDPRERTKIVQFLYQTVMKTDKLDSDVQDLLIEQGKMLLDGSSAEEFLAIMAFLTKSKMAKTINGQQQLVNFALERCMVAKAFNLKEEEICAADRIILCVKSVLHLFNANVSSQQLVMYFCLEILPQWKAIRQLKTGEVYQAQFVRILAELSIHCGALERPLDAVTNVFEILKMYMPLPPEDHTVNELPNLDFTIIECLLFTFHKLVRQCPEFLSPPAVLKDFKMRLSYLARGVGGCKRATEMGGPSSDLKKEEKFKVVPQLLNNISLLIKDLFYVPPNYKSNITLSFKNVSKEVPKPSSEVALLPRPQPPERSLTQRRHTNIRYQSSSPVKRSRISRGSDHVKLYSPPNGKFSNTFHNYQRSGPSGRGRANSRVWINRGRSRSWRN